MEDKKKLRGDGSVEAFMADMELEKYRHRVEAGELTEEEMEDRRAVLEFLGYGEEGSQQEGTSSC